MVIEPQLMDRVWPLVWPLIKKAVFLETEEQLLGRLKSASAFLIIVGDGVAVLTPCNDFLEINYVGGKNSKKWWPQMSKLVDSVATSYGSKKIISIGRDAWAKLAPDYKAMNTRLYIKEVA